VLAGFKLCVILQFLRVWFSFYAPYIRRIKFQVLVLYNLMDNRECKWFDRLTIRFDKLTASPSEVKGGTEYEEIDDRYCFGLDAFD